MRSSGGNAFYSVNFVPPSVSSVRQSSSISPQSSILIPVTPWKSQVWDTIA